MKDLLSPLFELLSPIYKKWLNWFLTIVLLIAIAFSSLFLWLSIWDVFFPFPQSKQISINNVPVDVQQSTWERLSDKRVAGEILFYLPLTTTGAYTSVEFILLQQIEIALLDDKEQIITNPITITLNTQANLTKIKFRSFRPTQTQNLLDLFIYPVYYPFSLEIKPVANEPINIYIEHSVGLMFKKLVNFLPISTWLAILSVIFIIKLQLKEFNQARLKHWVDKYLPSSNPTSKIISIKEFNGIFDLLEAVKTFSKDGEANEAYMEKFSLIFSSAIKSNIINCYSQKEIWIKKSIKIEGLVKTEAYAAISGNKIKEFTDYWLLGCYLEWFWDQEEKSQKNSREQSIITANLTWMDMLDNRNNQNLVTQNIFDESSDQSEIEQFVRGIIESHLSLVYYELTTNKNDIKSNKGIYQNIISHIPDYTESTTFSSKIHDSKISANNPQKEVLAKKFISAVNKLALGDSNKRIESECREIQKHWAKKLEQQLRSKGIATTRILWFIKGNGISSADLGDANYDLTPNIQQLKKLHADEAETFSGEILEANKNKFGIYKIDKIEVTSKDKITFIVGKTGKGKSAIRIKTQYSFLKVNTDVKILPVLLQMPYKTQVQYIWDDVIKAIAHCVANELFARLCETNLFLELNPMQKNRVLDLLSTYLPDKTLASNPLFTPSASTSIVNLHEHYNSHVGGAQFHEICKQINNYQPQSATDIQSILTVIQQAVKAIGYKHIILCVDNLDEPISLDLIAPQQFANLLSIIVSKVILLKDHNIVTQFYIPPSVFNLLKSKNNLSLSLSRPKLVYSNAIQIYELT